MIRTKALEMEEDGLPTTKEELHSDIKRTAWEFGFWHVAIIVVIIVIIVVVIWYFYRAKPEEIKQQYSPEGSGPGPDTKNVQLQSAPAVQSDEGKLTTQANNVVESIKKKKEPLPPIPGLIPDNPAILEKLGFKTPTPQAAPVFTTPVAPTSTNNERIADFAESVFSV